MVVVGNTNALLPCLFTVLRRCLNKRLLLVDRVSASGNPSVQTRATLSLSTWVFYDTTCYHLSPHLFFFLTFAYQKRLFTFNSSPPPPWNALSCLGTRDDWDMLLFIYFVLIAIFTLRCWCFIFSPRSQLFCRFFVVFFGELFAIVSDSRVRFTSSQLFTPHAPHFCCVCDDGRFKRERRLGREFRFV